MNTKCCSGSCGCAKRMDDTHRFIFDLTDPEKWGFAVTAEVRKRAVELLELFPK